MSVAPPPTCPPPATRSHQQATLPSDRAVRSRRGWSGNGVFVIVLGLLLVGGVVGVAGALTSLLAIGAPAVPSRIAGDLARAATPAQAGRLALPPTCTAASRTALRRSVDVGSEEWICGNVTVAGGDVTVEGVVGGSVTVADGDVTIAGQVTGSVTAIGGDVELRSGAVVDGGVTVLGGSLRRAADSRIGGDVQDGLGSHPLGAESLLGLDSPYSFPWAPLIFWGLAGAALALFCPRQLSRVRRAVRYQFAQSLALGAVAWVAGALLTIALFITCLGIPLALVLGAGLWIASVVGTVAIGLWLGERLLGIARREGRSPVAATLVGVCVIALAKSVPCVGALIAVLVAAAGLGAALLALRESRALVRR